MRSTLYADEFKDRAGAREGVKLIQRHAATLLTRPLGEEMTAVEVKTALTQGAGVASENGDENPGGVVGAVFVLHRSRLATGQPVRPRRVAIPVAARARSPCPIRCCR